MIDTKANMYYSNNMNKRIGFACKYMHPDQTQKKKLLEEIQRPLNTRSTTVQWLNRQTKDVAEERLWTSWCITFNRTTT